MKKRSLIFGLAVFVCSALIFNACEQEAETETQTVTKIETADIKALKELLATDGVSTVDYRGPLEIGDETLIIPAGKTLNVTKGGVEIKDGILGVVGTLNLPSGAGITLTGTGQVFSNVDVPGVKAEKIHTGIDTVKEAFTDTTGAVDVAAILDVNGADLTAANVPAGNTLLVLGNLTVASTAPAASAGNVKVEGKLVLEGTASIADWPTTVDYSEAILKNSNAATVTLPATATLKAIDATTAKLTIAGGTSGITLSVGGITGEVDLTGKVTVAATGTINVKDGAKLTASGTELAIAGKLTVASGGTIVSPALAKTGLPDDASKITFSGDGAIELAHGAIGYYGTTAFIGPATGENPYFYNWDAGAGGKVTLKDKYVTELTAGNVTAVKDTGIAADTTITVANNAKLTVASGVIFTVGGTLEVLGEGGFDYSAGTLTIVSDGEVIENVSTAYALAEADSGVDVHATSAHLDAKAVRTKTASLETVDVTLTPKSGGTAITWLDNFNIADQPANGLWGGKVSGAPNDWKWTDVSINVISFFNGISDKILSVKSTSQAYRYYKGAPNIWTTAPTVPTIGDPNIFIVDDTNTLPIKWKIYAANRFTAEENPTWGIILSDKASPKEIVIEIREHDTIPTGEPHSTGNSTSNSEDLAADAGTPIKKLVIDYSAVT